MFRDCGREGWVWLGEDPEEELFITLVTSQSPGVSNFKTYSRFHCSLESGKCLQWNPSKADNLEPHILSITLGCPLWRGCVDVNGKTIGTQKFVRYIEVSVIEGCPLNGVPLYNIYLYILLQSVFCPHVLIQLLFQSVDMIFD